MTFSMDNYNTKKSELESQKVEAEATFSGEKLAEIEQSLLKLEQEKAEFEKLSSIEIPKHLEEQIMELGGDLKVTEEIDKEIEGVKEEVEKEVEKVIEKEVVNSEEEQKQITELTTEREKLYGEMSEIKNDRQEIKKEIEKIKNEQQSEYEERMKPFHILEKKYEEVLNQCFNEKIRPQIVSTLCDFEWTTNPETKRITMDSLKNNINNISYYSDQQNATYVVTVFELLVELSSDIPKEFREMKTKLDRIQGDAQSYADLISSLSIKDSAPRKLEYSKLLDKIRNSLNKLTLLSPGDLYKPMNMNELIKSGYLGSGFQVQLDKERETRNVVKGEIWHNLAVIYSSKIISLDKQLSEKNNEYYALDHKCHNISERLSYIK
jgi:hypothetical protein